MSSVFEWLYGSHAASDPMVMHLDKLLQLTPWWYPWMWAVIAGTWILVRQIGRFRRRSLDREALERVRTGTRTYSAPDAVVHARTNPVVPLHRGPLGSPR